VQALKLTDNSKTKFKPNHRNTFGLNFGRPDTGGTCPGATKGAGGCLCLKKEGGKVATCYMAKLVKVWPSVGKSLQSNTDLIQDKTYKEMVDILTLTVEEFITKNSGENLYFRLHYSGDFFSKTYAKAWVEVIKKYGNVHFWVYTRSFDCAPLFVDIKNVTIFLSVDPVNYKKGLAVYEKYKDVNNLGMAWMGNTPPVSQRWVTCPETSGKLKNTAERGACGKCRLCVDNYVTKVKNIQFLIH
jgi:hypothetical protein